VALEKLPVDVRLVVVTLEVAERGELDEVRVTLVRLVVGCGDAARLLRQISKSPDRCRPSETYLERCDAAPDLERPTETHTRAPLVMKGSPVRVRASASLLLLPLGVAARLDVARLLLAERTRSADLCSECWA